MIPSYLAGLDAGIAYHPTSTAIDRRQQAVEILGDARGERQGDPIF
jgi:hypothetical protein